MKKLQELLKEKPALISYPILFDEFFKEMYGEQFGEFVSGYWGFKS